MDAHRMRNVAPAPLIAACLALASLGAAAQTVLQPSAQRLSDAAISADQRGYEAMQARIKAVNDAGRALRDYHLAKAQCWLDVSFHEYTRNDRGAFPQAALAQSESLVQAMQAGTTPLPMDTPLVAGAQRLREDLWQRANALRGHAGWSCAAAKTACAEVELVHAGHEHAQIGWRHAKPYVQIAEDLLADAQTLAQQCPTAAPAPVAARPVAVPAPAPVVLPPPPPPAAAVITAPLTLMAQVIFRFDRAQQADILPASLASLQTLVQRVKGERLVVQSIGLAGHADRLNGSGKPDYNQRLSERRVETVRKLLVAQGVDVTRLRTEALGDRTPALACDAPKSALPECLTPNRRVEVSVTALRP
jgi:OmpA-OmpF porin, OOP family